MLFNFVTIVHYFKLWQCALFIEKKTIFFLSQPKLIDNCLFDLTEVETLKVH